MANEVDQFLSETQPIENVPTTANSQVDQFLQETNPIEETEPTKKTANGEEGVGNALLKGVVAIGEFIDSFSGAPTRSAIQAGLKGENPLVAFGKQFAEAPQMAPTGKQIAAGLGVSTEESNIPVEPVTGVLGFDPGDLRREVQGEPKKERHVISLSPAGVVGLGIDIVADPLAFIPIGKVLKGTGRVVKGTGKAMLKGSAAAADLALGTDKISNTGKIIGKSLDDITENLKQTFKPKVAKDFEQLKEIAVKNNIDPNILPESVEFGKESFISRATRQRRELGGESVEQFAEAVRQTGDALTNKIKEISKTGDVLDNASAGALIRDAYDRGVKEFFDGIDVTHNAIIANNPGLKLSKEAMANLESKLKGVEKFAKGRVARGADPIFVSQGKRLLKNIENIRKSNGSYKQAVETLREIGEVSYKSKNTMATIPADVNKMRDIYSALNQSLIDTVEKSAKVVRDDKVIKGGELANNLILNNARITDFFGDKSVLKRIGDKNISNEALFRNIITQGDSKKVEALRNIVSPEDFNQLKAAFLDDITKVNQEGNILFRSTFNTLDNKKNIVKELLNPNEVKEFTEILDLGDRIGIPVLSTSGTGASNIISNIVSNIKNVTSNDLLIDNLKTVARNQKQLEIIDRLTEAVSKDEAIAIIKRAKLPKKIERAAINKLRKINIPLTKPKPIFKIPQVLSVQERQRQIEKGNE